WGGGGGPSTASAATVSTPGNRHPARRFDHLHHAVRGHVQPWALLAEHGEPARRDLAAYLNWIPPRGAAHPLFCGCDNLLDGAAVFAVVLTSDFLLSRQGVSPVG